MSGAARALGAAFVLAPALATAGPNADGALVLHVNESIVYSDGVDYCGQSGLGTCQEASVTTPVDSESVVVCFVVGAFPLGSSPRVKAVAFGIDYDVNRLALTDHGPCGGFALPTADWPAPGAGTALVLDSVSEAALVEIYWFAAYVSGAGEPTSLEVGPHPVQGGQFADDSVPAVVDLFEDYGRLGFGEDGYLPCPGSGAPDGPDGPDEPGSSGLDPWEFNPCNESVLVAASWGSGWADFAPPTHWGEAQEYGPGPFAVDEQGWIYIMDLRQGDMKVYSPEGQWSETIELPDRTAVVPQDLSVAFGLAVWREGETWIRMMVIRNPSSVVSIRTPSFGRSDSRLPGSLPGSLVRTPTGISFYDENTWLTTPLTQLGEILSAGSTSAIRGLEISQDIHVAQVRASARLGADSETVGPILTQDGSRALGGDIIRLAEDGVVEGIFAKSAGGPIGVNGRGEVLAYKTEQVGNDPYANYVDIYSPEGTLLSRTRESRRFFNGRIDLGPRFRMGEDGFYEIWISTDAVHVSHWTR